MAIGLDCPWCCEGLGDAVILGVLVGIFRRNNATYKSLEFCLQPCLTCQCNQCPAFKRHESIFGWLDIFSVGTGEIHPALNGFVAGIETEQGAWWGKSATSLSFHFP